MRTYEVTITTTARAEHAVSVYRIDAVLPHTAIYEATRRYQHGSIKRRRDGDGLARAVREGEVRITCRRLP
jgi:hypothetical protein